MTILWYICEYLSVFREFKLEETRPKTMGDQSIIHQKFRREGFILTSAFYKDVLHRILKQKQRVMLTLLKSGNLCLLRDNILTQGYNKKYPHPCGIFFGEKTGCVHQPSTSLTKSVSFGLLSIFEVKIYDEWSAVWVDRWHRSNCDIRTKSCWCKGIPEFAYVTIHTFQTLYWIERRLYVKA